MNDPIIAFDVNETLLDTRAACGDVERNVLCCPAPIHDTVRAQMQEDCARIAAHFAPRSSSYWDIWLDGEKVDNPDAPTKIALCDASCEAL